MTYELAKQLKDTGFPQPGKDDSGKSGMGFDVSGDTVYYDNCCSFWRDGKDGPDAYIPTLSELIEACGQQLDHLINNIHEWKASGTKGEFGKGSTPEEAVATLWLTLHAN